MANHNSLATLFQDIADKIRGKLGDPAKIKADDFPSKIESMPRPATLPQKSTTVRTSASATTEVVSNDNIRILGSDGNKYTIAEWNALFVAAGYDKTQMTITPKGLAVDAFEHSGESYLFDRYTGEVYNPVGDSKAAAGLLQMTIYNSALVSAAENGTDYTTGKAWSVTAEGNNLILSEANTGQSWAIAKNTGYVNAHVAYNIADATHTLWAHAEWMRHRMAIDSGISTSKTDGTMGEIAIYNSAGSQAAANEDMYFWIKNDSDVWVSTGKQAKYNLNNRHGLNSANLTSAIADAIYARQKANGINMNDTGVNSSTKPVLAPGSKGAEVIAVGGKWYIITPFISNPSATTATATSNMADSPAVYWAKFKEYSLPSDTLLAAMYFNNAIITAAHSYLNSIEGWGLTSLPTANSIWSAFLYSAAGAWNVNIVNGNRGNNGTITRYMVVGALSE